MKKPSVPPRPSSEDAASGEQVARPDDPLALKIAELQDDRDQMLERLKRARADLINYQNRVERDVVEVRRFALQGFVTEVLAVVDDFDRALESTEASRDFDVLLQGVRLMESRLKKLLADIGVYPIDAAGKPFDPRLHEAVLQEENPDVPSNTVLDELQRGYMLHDRVLRPSRVKVAKAPEEQPEDQPEDQPGERPEDRQSPEFD